MKLIISITVSIILSFLPLKHYSQELIFDKYSVNDGLPSSNINCIIQDHFGYLWIGTDNGISQYDGFTYKNIDVRNGLANQKVSSILETNDNKIWIGHSNGEISVINRGSNTIIRHQFNLNARISSIKQDSLQNIWISTYGNGIFFAINSASDILIESIPFDENGKNNFINDILITSNNNVLAATDSGLIHVFKDASNIYQIKSYNKSNSKLLNNNINSMLGDNNQEIYVGTKEGLFKLKLDLLDNIKSLNLVKESKGMSFDYLSNNSEGLLWCNNKDNLYNVRNLKISKLNLSNSFINVDIKSIFNDNTNNLWIGTSNGLFKYAFKEFSFFNLDLNGIKTNSIIVDHKDKIWIGTNKGLIEYDPQNSFTENLKYIIENKKISSLFQDIKNNIWIGLEDQNLLYRYDYKKGKIIAFTSKDGYTFNNCSSIQQDESNNILFSSSRDTGLVYYTYPKNRNKRKPLKGRIKKLDYIKDFPRDIIASMYTENNKIWFNSKSNGLIQWDGQQIVYFEKNLEISSNKINTIIYDNLDNTWISTNKNGIYKYNGVFFKNLNLHEGLKTKEVLEIICDNYDDLWIITKEGMQKYDQYTEQFYNYNLPEKIRFTSDFHKSFKDINGVIWIIFEDGILRIDPDKSFQQEIQNETIIEEILLFNKPIKYSDFTNEVDEITFLPLKLKLSPDLNHISFNYTNVFFTDQEKIAFKYKLYPYELEWQPSTKNRSISYSNLAPGKYNFNIQTVYGNVVSEVNEFSFKIKSPVYKQFWFYIIIVLAFALLVYVFILLRIRYFKKVNLLLKESYDDRSKLLSSAYNDIESNIKYAKNIQNAVLRNEEDLGRILHSSFVFSQPKESIGGDFFWYSRKSRKIFIAVADCIGHGVPGAFMSLIGHNLLNQTINEVDSFDPPFILEEVSRNFDRAIKNTLLDIEKNNDMDIAFCRIDRDRKEIVFSGANSTIYFIQNNKLNEFKGNKRAIGQDNEIITHFSRSKTKYKSGDILYMFTNGFADQFGGPENKRFRSTRLKNLLVNVHDLPMEEQKAQIMEAFEKWKGESEQIDDVLVLGIRL